ncbi:MAG: hypothetical protein P1P88_24105 [Bacteroidales bacterium]|nr:hypothetical protein [Bacteroidales bacterium]
MLFKIIEERPIKSLKDIRLKKQQLETLSKKKSDKLKRRADRILTNTSPQIVYNEILEKFNLQHSLMNMLPLLLKYKDQIANLKLITAIKKSPKKRAGIIVLGSLITGITTYLYINKKNSTKL